MIILIYIEYIIRCLKKSSSATLTGGNVFDFRLFPFKFILITKGEGAYNARS
jgi:hypothetical protein